LRIACHHPQHRPQHLQHLQRRIRIRIYAALMDSGWTMID
jgi:hypothetical protein